MAAKSALIRKAKVDYRRNLVRIEMLVTKILELFDQIEGIADV